MSLFTVIPVSSSRTDLPIINAADIESLKDFKIETDAYAQYSFGASSASLTSLINNQSLTLVSSASNTNVPTYSQNYLSFNSGRGTYLATNLTDNSSLTGFTLSAVVRVPTQTLTTTGLYGLMGIWSASSYGAIAYCRNGKINCAASAGQVHTETINQRFDKWMHITLSIDNVARTLTLTSVIDNVMTTNSYALTSRVYSDAVIGLGNMFVAGTTYMLADCAELIVFNKSVTAAEITAVYQRTKKRMAIKNIVI